MVERLGHVLGWAGNILATILVGLGSYVFLTNPLWSDPWVFAAFLVLLGLVVFLIGRAARYVLAG
jgi:hypothetical protein